MKYLLDTQAFIWLDSNPEKLTAAVKTICVAPENQLILSLVSVWEMQVKLGVGKLTLPAPLTQIINEQRIHNQLQLLSIELRHIFALAALPYIHRDPFDRLLVAQAQVEGLTLITSDPMLGHYPVSVVW